MTRPTESLQVHLIRLFAGDFDRLAAIYHVKRPNAVIRQLVRKHVDDVEQKIREKESQDV